VITDTNGNILYANSAAERNTGFSVVEMIGRTPGDLWGGHMPEDFYRRMWHTIKDELRPFHGEVRNVKKDGDEYWQDLLISPILDDNGNVRFFVGVEPDITDRKTREQFREEFVAMAGHQLKNPLSSIQWTIELLLKQGSFTAEQRALLRSIYEKDIGLLRLVSDLSLLARFGAEALVSAEEFDLVLELKSIVERTRHQYPAVSFSFEYGDMQFLITSTKSLLTQVFENIIINSARYSDKTKEIQTVHIALQKEADGYVFSCKDNGIGIPDADQQNIFSRFFRSENAQQREKDGTGLGLFIVKTIADALGYHVAFESSIGMGTTFFVRMPYSG
jgi:PAS domain S-box-containing protein